VNSDNRQSIQACQHIFNIVSAPDFRQYFFWRLAFVAIFHPGASEGSSLKFGSPGDLGTAITTVAHDNGQQQKSADDVKAIDMHVSARLFPIDGLLATFGPKAA